jgi:hypothetical protein
MYSGYCLRNDDQTNKGIKYIFNKGEFKDLEVVETAVRKKVVSILPVNPTFIVQDGVLNNGENGYTSIYGHGIVKGNIVRIEDTEEFLVVITNEERNLIQFNNSLVSARYAMCNN